MAGVLYHLDEVKQSCKNCCDFHKWKHLWLFYSSALMQPQDIILPPSNPTPNPSCCKSPLVMRKTNFTFCWINCLILYSKHKTAVGVWDASWSLQGPVPSPGMQAEILPGQEAECTSPPNCVSALPAMLREEMMNAICAIAPSVTPGSPSC